MRELLIFIYKKLKEINLDIFNQDITKDAEYPFIDFSISQPFRNNNPELYTLIINIWDKKVDRERVERVADRVDLLLEELLYNDENFYIRIKKQSRQPVEDIDINIKRVEIVYLLRVFKV